MRSAPADTLADEQRHLDLTWEAYEAVLRELAGEPFILHHLCGSTAELIHRLFEQSGVRCKVAARLWSFENIKNFVPEQVGIADVGTRRELAANDRVT